MRVDLGLVDGLNTPRDLQIWRASGEDLTQRRGFVDHAAGAAAAGLRWTTLRVAHRAGLRPQAPQRLLLLCQKTKKKTYKGSRPFATPRFLALGSE